MIFWPLKSLGPEVFFDYLGAIPNSPGCLPEPSAISRSRISIVPIASDKKKHPVSPADSRKSVHQDCLGGDVLLNVFLSTLKKR